MANFKIFVIEDDPWYGELIKYHLELNPEYEVNLFDDAKKCLANLHKRPNLITIDFSLPDMTGDELYKAIRKVDSTVPVVVISSQEDISIAVGLMKMGAADYLVKNDNTKDLLWRSILRIRENVNLKEEVETLKEELGQKYSFENAILGQSPAIKKVFNIMNKAIQTNINVSITGETGTGKELVAKAIHFNGARKKKKFVAVNMSAIPSELVESELFGYEKGAFTGALARKIGKFEEANGGTIFLDEIAELSLNLQSKLLRVLQERELERVGGNETISLDIRIITATHKNLQEEVSKGRFREDLYFRVLGLPIELPPLRNRGNDVLLLARNFAEGFAKENKMQIPKFSDDAIKKLMSYDFPGNIRELKAIIELAVVFCNDATIEANDINFVSVNKNRHYIREAKTLREYTCDIIQQFLDKNDGDVLQTAEDLDIGKSTIYKMLKEGEISANSK